MNPIEDPEEIDRLVAAARQEGLFPYVFVVTLLDAGLRFGEALGLRWGAIAWGADDGDRSRALLIDRSRPRGREVAPPKSGRTRGVALSGRLRDALAELYAARFEPGPDVYVFEGIEPNNFRHREWRRILIVSGRGSSPAPRRTCAIRSPHSSSRQASSSGT